MKTMNSLRRLKFGFSFLALWVSGVALAGEVREFPTDFHYKKQDEDRNVLSEIHAEDLENFFGLFIANGFRELNQDIGNGEDFLGADQILVRDSDQKRVFFIMNAEPQNPKYRFTLMREGTDLIYHSVTPTGLHYGILLEGFSEQDAKTLVLSLNDWSASVFPDRKTAFLDWVLPRAEALRLFCGCKKGDPDCRKTPRSGEEVSAKAPTPVPISQGQSLGSEVSASIKKAVMSAFNCGAHALMGGVDQVIVKPVKFVGRTIRTVVRFVNPMTTRDELRRSKETLARLGEKIKGVVRYVFNRNLIRNLSDDIHAKSAQFRALSEEERLAKVCDFGGRVAATLVLLNNLHGISESHFGREVHKIWDRVTPRIDINELDKLGRYIRKHGPDHNSLDANNIEKAWERIF